MTNPPAASMYGPSQSADSGPPESAVFLLRGPGLIAALATLSVLLTLDPSGHFRSAAPAPGFTLDEVWNVQMGVYDLQALRSEGVELWFAPARDRLLGIPGYNPDHPPLGRLWLGLCHELTASEVGREAGAAAFSTGCARVGSALAYGLTILLVGWFAGLWFGARAGWMAAIAYALMPRVFAHAHFAALETPLNFTYTAAVLYATDWYRRTSAPNVRTAIIAGLIWGCALLTKMQAVLAPAPIALWLLWRWRQRGILPLVLAGITGVVVFVCGWPWLWIDLGQNLQEYFLRSTDRVSLDCWYLGREYVDVDVPWHYPFVMFAVTVPVGLQVLGIVGVAARGTERTPIALMLASVLLMLTLFALPGRHVYDGVRLFLVVFPLWAIVIGRGGSVACEWLRQRTSSRTAFAAVALFLMGQAYGLIALHPCQLSYYNLLVGGLRGADRLGFERSYWADSITETLVEQLASEIPPGTTLYVAPVLHTNWLADLEQQLPQLRSRGIRLRPYTDEQRDEIEYVLVFRRRADSWASLEPAPLGGRLLAEVRREGVQLAAMYALQRD